MSEELNKDMVLLAKYMRRLALKYPRAYITSSKVHGSTRANVTYLECKAADGERSHYSDCIIDDTGKVTLI